MTKLLIQLLALFAAMMAPVQTVVFVCIALVFFDLVTGLWVAVRSKRRITSARLGDSVRKLIGYLLLIVLGYHVQKAMFSDDTPVFKVLTGLIGGVEFKSIVENLENVTGRRFMQRLDAFLKPVRNNDVETKPEDRADRYKPERQSRHDE